MCQLVYSGIDKYAELPLCTVCSTRVRYCATQIDLKSGLKVLPELQLALRLFPAQTWRVSTRRGRLC